MKYVFDKLKYFLNRISEKFEGNLARKQEAVDVQDLQRTRQRLEQMRSRTTNNPESTGSFAMDQVRRRITHDVQRDTTATSIERNRHAINKWLHREDYEPAHINSREFNHRLETSYRPEERVLEPLPAIEDTFMAFNRPEEGHLFEDNAISLSGVHYKVDPMEAGDDIFLTKVTGDQRPTSDDIDFSPVTSFDPDSNTESMAQQNPVKISNPMIQSLATLEERMAQGYRTKDGFWVGNER